MLDDMATKQSVYTLFLNNQKKQYSNLTKEQQKCCNYIKMLDGNGLRQDILLKTTQKIRLRHAFNNNMSTVLKLSKARMSKILQSGQFLWSLLSKLAGPLMKVTVPFAKIILAPLGITLAASAIDGGIQKNPWFRDNDFNNFKQRNQWYNKNRWSS